MRSAVAAPRYEQEHERLPRVGGAQEPVDVGFDFGLHAGQAIPIGAYDVLDYILRSSETVHAAIEKTSGRHWKAGVSGR